jgi:hypothetical protein
MRCFKKGAISSDKVVAVVLVVLVILVAVGFFVSKNPNWYYKLIPDLNQTYGDDEVINVPVDVAVSPCLPGIQVANLVNIKDNQVIQIGSETFNNKLLWDSKKNEITFSIFLWFDPVIGKTQNGVVVIDPKYLDPNSDIYSKEASLTPEKLGLLNGVLLKGDRFCRIDGINANGVFVPSLDDQNVNAAGYLGIVCSLLGFSGAPISASAENALKIIQSAPEVIVAEGTVVKGLDFLDSATGVGKVTQKYAAQGLENVVVNDAGVIVGQISSGGGVRLITEEMARSAGVYNDVRKFGYAMTKGSISSDAQLVLKSSGKVVGTVDDLGGALLPSSRVLKLVQASGSVGMKVASKVGVVLGFAGAACDLAALAYVVGEAAESSSQFIESGQRSDEVMGKLVESVDSKTQEINSKLDSFKERYDAGEFDGEPELKSSVEVFLLDGQDLNDINVQLNNLYLKYSADDSKKITFFRVASEFTDLEWSVLMVQIRNARDQLNKIENDTDEINRLLEDAS